MVCFTASGKKCPNELVREIAKKSKQKRVLDGFVPPLLCEVLRAFRTKRQRYFRMVQVRQLIVSAQPEDYIT